MLDVYKYDTGTDKEHHRKRTKFFRLNLLDGCIEKADFNRKLEEKRARQWIACDDAIRN